MASATTRPALCFHLSTSLPQPSPPKPKPHLTFPPLPIKSHSITAPHKRPNPKFASKSIDVSKEDKPISEQPNSATPAYDSEPPPPPESQTIDDNRRLEEKFAVPEFQTIDKRRLEEKFAVLNTGIYECRSCGYLYDEAAGDPSYPVAPGMPFGKLPEDWRCPTCGAAQTFFESKSVEIAGFAQNQQFGLGGNALTSSQKAVLIYGGLLLGFVLFLSGYFIQ